jgi:predicted KAP-like P-loop ATPase
MNEREALQFIMEELKEQRRADFDMYFEMRKNITNQYDRFLDRLRDLDDRDRKLNEVEPKEHIIKHEKLRAFFEDKLPEPKFKGTTEELRVDRIKVEEEEPIKSEKKEYVNIEKDVKPIVVEYMKNADGSEPLRDIQYYAESELGTTWVNFSIVMSRIMESEPRIQRSKVKGYYIWRD